MVFIFIFAVLFLRLVQLQIAEGNKYRKLAEENAAKTVPALAPRGLIYDRNGKVLVQNRAIFSLQILPQLLSSDEKKRDKVLGEVSRLLGQKVEYKFSAHQPMIVRENVDLKTALCIAEKKDELEGVVISSRPVRSYPQGGIAAHVLGYVGEVEAEDLKNEGEGGYRRGSIVGKDGVEKFFDQMIRGEDGGKKVEVDVYGSPVRLLESFDPIPGANVVLTIDSDLQKAVEGALGYRPGAVVVLDPNTGEILALASHPDYDPNLFTGPVERAKWENLSRRRHPFINRALAIYPPGSIFKAVTLTAALEEKVVKDDEVFYCPGYYRVNNRVAKCWKESGHGHVTLAEGLVQSCDIVFYELGKRLGPERIMKYARMYGLGEKTGIDLPQEKRGLVPNEEWKKKQLGEPWYDGDSINYGIGQGFLQVTPIQMAALYGAVATGKRMKPYIVKEIVKPGGEIIYQGRVEEVSRVAAKPKTMEVIRKALKDVVVRGTGIAARVEGMPAAGKTGTAQNPGLPHAWFLCYAPADKPEIVIASFVEHGEHGDRSAAYVARDILEWYKKKSSQETFDKQQ